MNRRPLRLLASATFVLALSACGFQLRDALSLPPGLDPVKVVARDRYSPLAESLAQGLERAGATPANSRTERPAVLDIKVERWGDTPISVDSLGRAQEFSLRYAVVFELRNGDGSVLVPQQNIELARDYISVPNNSIGTEGERDILEREMRREMASGVLRRIDAVGRESTVGADPATVFLRTTDAAEAAMAAANAIAPLPVESDKPASPVTEPEASADPVPDTDADPAPQPEPQPGQPR